MAKLTRFLLLITAAALSARAAAEIGARLDRAAGVFAKLTTPPHGIRPEQIDSADCIAVLPGFKKGAAVVGVGFGRGFISCRTDAGWSVLGKPITNTVIVNGGTPTPEIAEAFVSKLGQGSNR